MSEESERIFLTRTAKRADFTVPVAFPNQEFDIPKDAPYGEFHILGGDPLTIGGEGEEKVRTRWVGLIQLTIWVPKDQGTKPQSINGDKLKTCFARKQGWDDDGEFYRFNTLQKFSPTKTPAGWSCKVYRISYTRDEVEDIPAGATL